MIPEPWSGRLRPETRRRARQLWERAQKEREEGHVLYPAQENIFRALELTPPEKVRVVLTGQDPYHTPGAANGLAFSVSPGVKIPPSLRNIFQELSQDLGCGRPSSGDLTPWAREGVLLLNTILTVEQGKPASHRKWGWQEVVAEVLQICARDLPQPVVFLLWGGYARGFAGDLDLEGRKRRACLCSSHPSPLGARKGSEGAPAFLGSRPFSRSNRLLEEMGAEPVNWVLP